jgi:hypothetical protein
VLATGYGGGMDRDQARALGVGAVLFQPATVVSLGDTVRRALAADERRS